MEEINIKPQFNRMVEVMTDNIGVVQHSDLGIPIKRDRSPYPYSIDDVARALVVVSRFSSLLPNLDSKDKYRTYLNFIKRAMRPDGFFYNYQDLRGEPMKEPQIEEDCFSRVMWALSEVQLSDLPARFREETRDIFEERLPLISKLSSLNSQALALIALEKYLGKKITDYNKDLVYGIVRHLSDELSGSLDRNSKNGWTWFSDKMNYDNARLPQALLMASEILGDERLLMQGKKSLDFLIKQSFRSSNGNNHDGVFYGIGNDGWFTKTDFLQGKKPPIYDQQTIEAGAMVEACVDASRILVNNNYKVFYARNAFEWFRGLNVSEVSMLVGNGGVYDAITQNSINKNQGAESLISYLLATSRLIE